MDLITEEDRKKYEEKQKTEKKKDDTPVDEEKSGIEVCIDHEKIVIGSGKENTINVTIKNKSTRQQEIVLNIRPSFKVKYREMEWQVGIANGGMSVFMSEEEPREIIHKVSMKQGSKEKLTVNIKVPTGAYYGDILNLVVMAYVSDEPTVSDTKIANIFVKQTIIAVKTTVGQEINVAREIGLRAPTYAPDEILSVVSPIQMKGYILVELMHPDAINDIIKYIKDAKNVVVGETTLDEIKHYLVPKPAITGISVGDIVEVIEGPFKGERAKIMEIFKDKDEVKVELFESMVPIPITVKADSIRLMDKEGT